MIRPARDDDAPALIALVGACFDEYPGCVLDVDGEMPHLRRFASHYAARGGRAYAVDEPDLVACAAWDAAGPPGTVELHNLYVAGRARRRGLGEALVRLVEADAVAAGAHTVELWSDTRFLDAHRLYERLGYVRQPETRELHDLSETVELFFRRSL